MEEISLAFIGFGEVGHVFCRDLLRRPRVRVAAFDVLFRDDPERVAEATAMGVTPASSAREAAHGASLVFSAVTAASSLAVAREAAEFLRPGQTLLDVNSVSPQTKRASAVIIEECGGDYVEAAVMAPVAGPGLAVPILIGGRQAAGIAPLLLSLGMDIRVVADQVGRASATKLCRSIVIKGLEALMIDCASAAAAFGVEDDVFTSLRDTFPATDFAALAQNMAARVRRHGVRRAAEMQEAAAMLRSMGQDPGLAEAIADAQLRRAEKH